MKRAALAIIVGLLAWGVVVSLIDLVFKLSIAGYPAAERTLTFTLGMMWARLGMGAVTSLIAGAVLGAVAPRSRGAPWVLGVVLLALFIPVHVRLWHVFPAWYHLTFLVPLAPLIAVGAWLKARSNTGSKTGSRQDRSMHAAPST
jgi:hypothetical protein